MALKVTSTTVYVPETKKPAGQAEPAGVNYSTEKPPPAVTQMVDHEIEKHEFRENLASGEGQLCITVEPGDDELGQISVGVQFEGQIGAYNKCVEQQQLELEHAAAWLEAFFDQLGGDFEVSVAAVPCPKATDPLKLEGVIGHLEKRDVSLSRTSEHKRVVDPTVSVERR
jgi:hypothetical protein